MVKTVAFVAMLLVAATALSGCATTLHSYRVYSYQCCTSADVNAVYAPGDTIHLHWTAHLTTQSYSTKPTSPTITAELLPGSRSVVGAKKLATKNTKPTPISQATAISPSIWSPEQAVSDIPIPLNAEPGYYTLSFLTTWPRGFSTGGATVVQVK